MTQSGAWFESDEPLRLTIRAREHAPGLDDYLESHRIVQLKFESLSEQAARDRASMRYAAAAAPVILIGPEDRA